MMNVKQPYHTSMRSKLLLAPLILCLLSHCADPSVFADELAESPCVFSPDPEFGGVKVNCAYRGLRSLDPAWFPEHTTTLILDGNPLGTLVNGTMGKLTRLRVISASLCELYTMEEDSLAGLTQLLRLNLNSNHLDLLHNELPSGVFSHVPHLKELRVSKNVCWNQTAARGLLADLASLETLEFGCCTKLQVGSAFESLRNLKGLHIELSELREVHNSSLQGLAHIALERLYFNGGRHFINQFDSGVFQYLPCLKVLRLYDIGCGNKRLLASLWPFENRHFQLIEFDLVSLHSFTDTRLVINDGIISAHDARYLQSIQIDEFRLASCRWFAVEPGFLLHATNFAKNIKTITFLNNFLGVADEWRTTLIKFTTLPSLKVAAYGEHGFDQFHMNDYLTNRFNTINKIVKFEEDSSSVQSTHNGNIQHDKISSMGAASELDQVQKQSKNQSIGLWWGLKALRVIRVFNHQGLTELPFDFTVRNGQNVREITVVNARKVILHGNLRNLLNVKLLDISGSGVYWRGNVLFESLRGITVLLLNNLKNSKLRDEWGSQRFTAILEDLTYLEAGGNNLDYLPADLFATNIKLKHAGFKGNRFPEIPMDLSTTPSLVSLDLRDNAILGLHNFDLKQVDKRLHECGNFSLSLTGNTLACGCEQLVFIGWLKTTHVALDSKDYPCISESGQLTSTGQLDTQAMWRQCVGQVAFWVTIVLLCVMALTFLLTYMWGKFKMAVQSYVFRVFVPKFRLKTPEDYKFDVFVGYADDDYRFIRHSLLPCLERELGLGRTYVHQRDLQSGFMDEQLLNAMGHSWRILLVISENFLYSYEKSQLMVKMCSGSVSAENPRRVVALVQDSLACRLPADLVPVLGEDSMLHVQTWSLPLTHAQTLRLKDALTQ